MDDELDIMELELELLPDMLELELLSNWMRSTVTVPAVSTLILARPRSWM
jgi:hypothetical protein